MPAGKMAIPLFECLCGPGSVLVGVTLVAGVGGAETVAQIRAGNPEAVVAAGIHLHERFGWHVAIHTLAARGAGFMEMVLRCGVVRGVALQADVVAFGL